MVNESGKTFNGSKTNDQTDCRIIHPLTKFIKNRPDWLSLSGKRKSYSISNTKISEFPILVLAYRKSEYEQNGIPADVIEIMNTHDKTNLLLKKGTYKIIIKNKKYKIINEFDVTVK